MPVKNSRSTRAKFSARHLKYSLPEYKVVLVKEPGAGQPFLIRTPSDLGELLSPLRHYSEEKFVVVFLNCRHEAIGVQEISHGTVSSSLVHPREVFKGALLANAHGMIFAHNHPSGSLKASPEDIRTTEQLIKAGEIMGIDILDHLILTDRAEYSIRENHPELWSQ